jgi:hypothetical protein
LRQFARRGDELPERGGVLDKGEALALLGPAVRPLRDDQEFARVGYDDQPVGREILPDLVGSSDYRGIVLTGFISMTPRSKLWPGRGSPFRSWLAANSAKSGYPAPVLPRSQMQCTRLQIGAAAG